MGNDEVVVVRKTKRDTKPSGKAAAACLALVFGGPALAGARTNTRAKALRALAEKCEEVLPPKLLRSVPLAEARRVTMWVAAAKQHIENAQRKDEDARDVEATCNPNG